jgi:acyl-CoA synthetase (AMP-forming)/AMP-acid ligase II
VRWCGIVDILSETAQLIKSQVITITGTVASRFLFGKPYTTPPNSVGILWPGLEARIVREDGSDAAVNEPGECLLRGPTVAIGYWKNEAATRGTFLEGGWIRTGDRLRVDEQGNFL